MVPTATELRVAGRLDESEFSCSSLSRERVGDYAGSSVLGSGGSRRDEARLHTEEAQPRHQTRRGHGTCLRLARQLFFF